MGKIYFKVDYNESKSALDHYDEVRAKIDSIGNFFPWDVHPNEVKTAKIQIGRLLKKLYDIVDTEEYQHYTSVK